MHIYEAHYGQRVPVHSVFGGYPLPEGLPEGAEVTLEPHGRLEHLLFGESQSRIVLTTSDPSGVGAIAARHKVECSAIGLTQDDELRVLVGGREVLRCTVAEVSARFEGAFPALLHVGVGDKR